MEPDTETKFTGQNHEDCNKSHISILEETLEIMAEELEVLEQQINHDFLYKNQSASFQQENSKNENCNDKNGSIEHCNCDTVDDLNDRIEILLREIKSREHNFRDTMKIKDDSIERLHQKVNQLAERVELLQLEIENYESDIHSKDMTIRALEERKKRFEKDLMTIHRNYVQRLYKLEVEKEETIDEIGSKAESLKADLYKQVEDLSVARQALLHKEIMYHDELKHNSDLTSKIQNLEEEIENLKFRDNKLHQCLKEASENKIIYSAEHDKLASDLEVLSEKLQESVASRREMENIITSQQKENVEDQYHITVLRQAIEEKDVLLEEIEGKDAEIETLRDKLNEALANNDKIEEIMAVQQMENVKDRYEINTLKEELQSKFKEITMLSEQLRDAVSENQDIVLKLADLQMETKENDYEIVVFKQQLSEKEAAIQKLREKGNRYHRSHVEQLENQLQCLKDRSSHLFELKAELETKIGYLSEEVDLMRSNEQAKEEEFLEQIRMFEQNEKISVEVIRRLELELTNGYMKLCESEKKLFDFEDLHVKEVKELQIKANELQTEKERDTASIERLSHEKSDIKEHMSCMRMEVAHLQCELRREKELTAEEKRLFQKYECENKLLKQRLKEEQFNAAEAVKKKDMLEARIVNLNTKHMYTLNRSSSIRSACFKVPLEPPQSNSDANDIGRSWCVIDMDNVSVNSTLNNMSRSCDSHLPLMSTMSTYRPEVRGCNSELHISSVSEIKPQSPVSLCVTSQSDNYIHRELSLGPLTSSHIDQTTSVPQGIGNLFSCEDEPIHVDCDWTSLSILKEKKVNTVIKKPSSMKKVKKYIFSNKDQALSKSWHNISNGNSQVPVIKDEKENIFKKPFSLQKRTPRQQLKFKGSKPESSDEENIAPSGEKHKNGDLQLTVKPHKNVLKLKKESMTGQRIPVGVQFTAV